MANPKVEIRPARRAPRDHICEWVVWCLTDGCEYAQTSLLKTDAQKLQRDHVRRHRMRQAERRAENRPEAQ